MTQSQSAGETPRYSKVDAAKDAIVCSMLVKWLRSKGRFPKFGGRGRKMEKRSDSMVSSKV